MTRDANSTADNEKIFEDQMNIPEELPILTLTNTEYDLSDSGGGNFTD
jgi:hypothetical protein